MKKSQGKLKLLGCTFATFVISAGLFVNLSSKRSHNCHVHAEDSIQWTLDTTTGYHSYINEDENKDWQARPVSVFYLERTSTVRVDCDIYDMTSSADGVLLEDTNVSFDFGIGANSYEIVSGDAGPVYRFQNLTCTECGATMQTFDMPIRQVGIVVSDYDEASWVYSSDIHFHKKNVSSQQFSYTAVPISVEYDSNNHYLRAICDVSIYDSQNNVEVIYQYDQRTFWYSSATATPGTTSNGYNITGICYDCAEEESFSIDSNVDFAYSDLSGSFPGGSGQQEDFSVSIYHNGEIVSEELVVSPELERITLSAQVSPTQPNMVYDWMSSDISVAQIFPEDSECVLDILDTGYSIISVTASYNGVTATASIELVSQEQEPETQAEITSLELLENPPTTYYVGDVINFQSIILVAHYSDGSVKEVTSNDYVAYLSPEGDPYEPLVSGDYMLYFTYEGVTSSGIPVYVNERQPETMTSYAVTYYPNGADEESHTDYTERVPEGDEVEYMLLQNMFSRPNYIFLGWSTDSSSQTPNYEEGEKVYLRNAIRYYAVWESQEPETQAEITSLELLENPPSIYYVGDVIDFQNIILVAHYSDGNIKEVTSNEYTAYLSPQGDPYEPLVAGDYMLYFTYEGFTTESGVPVYVNERQSETYEFEIIFVANNGTSETQIDPFTLPESSTTYDLPSIEQIGFTREGYSFVGWSYSSDGEVLTEAPVIQSGTTTTFYAIWELVGPRYQYTVTFDGNGATSGSTDPIILSGDDYSQTIIFPVCGYEREGYIFAGWGFTPEATIMIFQPGQERDITSDTTVYAIWTELFTISFDANGGEGTMDNITIPKGNASMPECGFTREGYSFAGWAVGSPTGDVYPVGASVYVSANYVLFATWEAITPITEIEISVAESEVVLYVDDSYIVQYTVTPEDAAGELIWRVEDEKVAAVIEDGMLVGLSVGSTTVTISDRSGNTSVSFVVYVVEKPVPVQPENPISEETIENISNAMDNMELSEEQTEKIQNVISENQEYISDEAGDIIYQALLGTTISSDDPVVAEAQKELVVAVVEAGVAVDAGKATNISGAQTIDKALPENANFSVEGEIQEFYERQMAELFGGEKPTRSLSRAGTPTHGIDTDTKGKEGQEAVDYLANEQLLYKKMGDFVESGVDHMGKAALKLRKCSGEAVTVQVKSYVTRVKVSSFREFDKEAADKEFVEAAYKAILLSMQNEVISILEKEHKPSNNAEKEAQYTKELEAVKDIESFEIMVTEVLRQKYVALTGENIEDVDAFHPIYWEIFSAWALDKPSPYPITLEELTQTTIEQSTTRARAFTINSDLTGGEWGFIAGIIAGSAVIITAAAVIPTVLKKKRAKEGNK